MTRDTLIARGLPQGNTLPYDVWLKRHRGLLLLVWLHAPALAIYALAMGFGVWHSLLEGGVIALIATAAALSGGRRRLASAVVSIGLVASSSVLVHVSGGLVEAHFHFFVVIVLLTIYEDWIAFLVAAAYVVLHHGLAGVIDASSVYNHADALANPLKWAGIHALFVTGAGAAAILAWRLNEDYRRQTAAAGRPTWSPTRSPGPTSSARSSG
jgi:hypothetical protein